jgi:HPt (histidine-containing phosphotransfer) domain-containing protein
VLDPAVLWEVCGGDAGMLERICPAFLVRMPDHPAAVQDALQQQDSSRLRESAHKLSGILAAFSIVASGVTSDLEDHAARGRLDEAGSLVERLETMAEDLIRLAGGLSLETLRQQIEAAVAPSGQRVIETSLRVAFLSPARFGPPCRSGFGRLHRSRIGQQVEGHAGFKSCCPDSL